MTKSLGKDSMYCIYFTAGMDISAGFVPAGLNITGGRDPGMNTNI